MIKMTSKLSSNPSEGLLSFENGKNRDDFHQISSFVRFFSNLNRLACQAKQCTMGFDVAAKSDISCAQDDFPASNVAGSILENPFEFGGDRQN